MINLIAAIDLNRGLGFENDLLVKLPSDMKNFKKLTTGHFVVMGSNTFKSIGHHLPNRQNIVITRNTKHDLPNDVYVYNSIHDVIHEYNNYSNKEVDLWVIGGQQIYEQFIEHADRLYLTVIDNYFQKVDTFFPPFNLLDWMVIENKENKADEKNPYDHYFVTYERRNNIK